MATYTKETALYDTAAISNDIQEAGTKASKYIAADSTGIMVYDGTNGAQTPSGVSAGTNNVFIDDDSVDVRTGSDVKASFGNPTIVGDATASHAEIGPDLFSIYNGVPTKCFSIESSASTLPVPVETPYNDTKPLLLLSSESTKSQTYNTSAHFIPTTADCLYITVTYGGIQNLYGAVGVGASITAMPLKFQNSSKTTLFSGYAYAKWTASTQTLLINSINRIEGTRSATLRFEIKRYSEIIEKPAPAMLYGQLAEDGSIGAYSFAEGYDISASGDYSHAEGYKTVASGDYSHAGGYQTVASGSWGAHAEGYKTVASSNGSHAEGIYTIAGNNSAHAEGSNTVAQGNASHAQNAYTVATGASQTVIGKYNKATVSGSGTSSNPYVYSDVGDYAFIIGNGSGNSTANRSNALTVDWNGNVDIASGAKYKINGVDLTSVLYPIGSCYTTSTNTNPSSYLGGTWTLIDKSLATAWISTGFTYNTTNTQNGTFTAILHGSSIEFRFTWQNKVAISDDNIVIGEIDLADVGINTSTALHAVYPIGYCDGLNAIGIFQFNITNTGNKQLVATDWVTRTTTYPTTTGVTCALDFTISVRHTAMLDSFCDHFVWKRTA